MVRKNGGAILDMQYLMVCAIYNRKDIPIMNETEKDLQSIINHNPSEYQYELFT
jgi:hypothetical protein